MQWAESNDQCVIYEEQLNNNAFLRMDERFRRGKEKKSIKQNLDTQFISLVYKGASLMRALDYVRARLWEMMKIT